MSLDTKSFVRLAFAKAGEIFSVDMMTSVIGFLMRGIYGLILGFALVPGCREALLFM